jgi:hypothetical protein
MVSDLIRSAARNRPIELREQKRLTAILVASEGVLFWGSIVGLFLLCHVTRDVVARLVTQPGVGLWFYLPSLKGILFLSCVGVLAHPIVTDTRRIFAIARKSTIRNTLVVSGGVAVLLALLVFHLGNESMGTWYALKSLSPFEQDTGWYNKRLFMPAVAHILFFRGGWLYYMFSSFVFVLFLCVLYSWLKNYTGVKPWHFLSLATCSFVIFQYQFPGYPDVVVFTLFVLVMTPEFTQKSKLCFLLLALMTHESSFFVGPILAYRYLNRRHRLSYVVALMLYGVIWATAYDFSIQAMFQNHDALGMSAVEWLVHEPHALAAWFLGVFIAFKAVWLVLVLATILALRCHSYRDAVFIAACTCAGLLITFLGVDTSRHMGVAFPGVLVALETIRHYMPRQAANRTLSIIFAANVVIPSFYVGLNTWIVLGPGLYKHLYFIFASIRHTL